MMRRALLGLVALPLFGHRQRPPAPVQSTVQTNLPKATVDAWNRFSRHSAEFFELVDANPRDHERRKQQLLDDFNSVFPLL